MRSTLFLIPSHVGGWPLFGFGVLLVIWAIASVSLLAYLVRKQGWNADTRGYLPLLVAFGLVIALVLPSVGDGRGLPIRGYGVMVLLGVVAGVALAVRRGRHEGVSGETIYSLALWMFVAGVVAARLFYVVQEWHTQFAVPGRSTVEVAKHVASVTEGGLVVYGAFLGATAAFVAFARRHGLRVLALADLTAPSMMLGLALGRIGCFLNGCCYGGVCALPWGVAFPPGSPPFMHQVAEHQIAADSLASLPVHPTQLYSALDAALICLLLLAFAPFRRREGEVFALMISVYPVTRYLIEILRNDVPKEFLARMTISQNISLALLACAAALWAYLRLGGGQQAAPV